MSVKNDPLNTSGMKQSFAENIASRSFLSPLISTCLNNNESAVPTGEHTGGNQGL